MWAPHEGAEDSQKIAESPKRISQFAEKNWLNGLKKSADSPGKIGQIAYKNWPICRKEVDELPEELANSYVSMYAYDAILLPLGTH